MFRTDLPERFPVQPAPESVLWRYMDITRFLSLLEHEALHFARADLMSDKWEGATGPYNDQVRSRPDYYGPAGEAVTAAVKKHRDALLKQTFMNCWQENKYESAAMWELYVGRGAGVALRTTWADRTASITDDIWVYGGNITYDDYGSTFIPEGDSFSPFMHKRGSYDHEKEVRLFAVPGTPGTEWKWFEVGSFEPVETVIPVAVDLRRLINSVYIAPRFDPWFAELVGRIVKRYGYDFQVRQSDIDSMPSELV